MHMQRSAAKVGPWGGSGGSPVDITAEPQRLKSITVATGIAVTSIAFSYVDSAGQTQSAGRWGGSGGETEPVVSGHARKCIIRLVVYAQLSSRLTLKFLHAPADPARRLRGAHGAVRDDRQRRRPHRHNLHQVRHKPQDLRAFRSMGGRE
jgi:hypothetical protein